MNNNPNAKPYTEADQETERLIGDINGVRARNGINARLTATATGEELETVYTLKDDRHGSYLDEMQLRIAQIVDVLKGVALAELSEFVRRRTMSINPEPTIEDLDDRLSQHDHEDPPPAPPIDLAALIDTDPAAAANHVVRISATSRTIEVPTFTPTYSQRVHAAADELTAALLTLGDAIDTVESDYSRMLLEAMETPAGRLPTLTESIIDGMGADIAELTKRLNSLMNTAALIRKAHRDH